MAQPRPTPSPFLTMTAAADLLLVEPKTIRRWIAAGRLPAYRVGHGVRIRREDVEAMIEPIPTAAVEHGTQRRRA